MIGSSSRRVRWALLASVLVSVGACTKATPTEPIRAPTAAERTPQAAPPATAATTNRAEAWDRTVAIDAGQAVISKHECTRCHVIDDIPKASRPRDCTSCHSFLDGLKKGERLYEKIAENNGEDLLLRYQKNIVHLKQDRVPDLTRLADRVQPLFIDRFLREPWDLRPVIAESMIRTNLTDDERQAVVRYFAAVAGLGDPYAGDPPPPPPRPADDVIDAGKALFSQKGCHVCHSFGNVDFGMTREALEASAATTALAPNLRFTLERTRHDVLVDWIVNPQQVKPGTIMPAMGATKEEAEQIAAFLRFGEPRLTMVKRAPPTLPPAASRKVTWAEVKEATLGKVCVHCHMNDYEKDPGPGNLGGLGYDGLGLSMRTYETLVQGALDKDGKRYSVLAPREPGGTPPILEVLVLRKREHWRDRLSALSDTGRPGFGSVRRGMPLGLPTLTDDEIAILRAWIEQGCEGPSTTTGKPGFWDGFLVPDGPIAKNRGCEQRDPSATRPAWAVDSEQPGVLPPSVAKQ
jgi:mono/diheme cytochrome c family protein